MILLETLGNPIFNIIIFALFVVGTLTVVIRVTAQQSKAAGQFYTGGASFSGTQNGFAIAGDYLSAASFLGIAGAIAFLAWYFAYVLASVYAKDFMSQPFMGESFNLGHFLGLMQFLTTFVITWLYIRHANRKVDPIAVRIRERLEGAAQ